MKEMFLFYLTDDDDNQWKSSYLVLLSVPLSVSRLAVAAECCSSLLLVWSWSFEGWAAAGSNASSLLKDKPLLLYWCKSKESHVWQHIFRSLAISLISQYTQTNTLTKSLGQPLIWKGAWGLDWQWSCQPDPFGAFPLAALSSGPDPFR